MSKVWFTSDLHLGHQFCAENRGFNVIAEHDEHIIETLNEEVQKHDKLYILGDVAFTDQGMQWAKQIKCQNVELILGNHDKYSIKKYNDYLGWKVHGFKVYNNYWLSHCPIHPSEMRQRLGNIHGHIHSFSDTQPIQDSRYICVNVEFHRLKPVRFETIQRRTSTATRGRDGDRPTI